MYRKENLKKETNRSLTRPGRLPIHISLFVSFQIMFILFDGSSIWGIFNVNNLGMRLVEFLHPFFDHFQPYKSEQLNYVTAIWGVVVLIDGLLWFIERKWGKQQ